MSSAFVKEDAAAQANLPGLPDRPVSAARNLVTRRGLAQIDASIVAHRDALAAAHAIDDSEAIAREERELRYWSARRASAEPGESDDVPHDRVRFGAAVTVRFEDGAQRRYRIVGEDEGDPEAGLIAWTTPVARALLGGVVGDTRSLPRGEVEIVAVEP